MIGLIETANGKARAGTTNAAILHRQKVWRAKNPEKIEEYNRRERLKYAANREEKRKASLARYHRNREAISAARKERYKLNRVQILEKCRQKRVNMTPEQKAKKKAYMLKFRRENAERIRKYAAEYNAKQLREHGDEIRAKGRARYHKDPEKYLARHKQYHRKNHEAIRKRRKIRYDNASVLEVAKRSAAKALYRQKNRDRLLKKEREYYRKNRDKISQKAKEAYLANPDKFIRKAKAFYRANRTALIALRRIYFLKNTAKVRASQSLHRVFVKKSDEDEFFHVLGEIGKIQLAAAKTAAK